MFVMFVARANNEGYLNFLMYSIAYIMIWRGLM